MHKKSEKQAQIFIAKFEVKSQLGRPRSRWEDNTKMNLRQIGCDGSIRAEDFCTSWVIDVICSRNSSLHNSPERGTDITRRESFVIPECWRSEGRFRSVCAVWRNSEPSPGAVGLGSWCAQWQRSLWFLDLYSLHQRTKHYYQNFWARQPIQWHDITRSFSTGSYTTVFRDTSIRP
jgi:hypothetical protein